MFFNNKIINKNKNSIGNIGNCVHNLHTKIIQLYNFNKHLVLMYND